MSDDAPLAPLLSALRDLLAWFRSQNVEGLIIGGVAASLLGRPRTTRDVDAVIWIGDDLLEHFYEAAPEYGLSPRLPDTLPFARESRVLLMHHATSHIDVDVVLGSLPFEREAIESAQEVQFQDVTLPLPRPEDLVIMKAVAHRPRDAADVQAVLEAHPRLDRDRVRGVVGEFAQAIETPELLEDLEAVFARVPQRDK